MDWMGLQFRGVISYGRGDVPTAQEYLHRAARVGHDAAEPVLEGTSLACIADNLCELGDCAAALPLLERAHQLTHPDPWTAVGQSSFMGKAALGVGDIQRARRVLEAGLAHAKEHDDPHSMTPMNLEILADVEMAADEPRRALSCLIRSLEMRHDAGERFGIVRTFDRLARLAELCSDSERSLRLTGATDRILEELGAQRTPVEQLTLDRWLLPLRERLGDDATVAWTEGHSFDLDEAVAFALSAAETHGEEPAANVGRDVAAALTPREQEVAGLLARGFSNRQIADELVISLHTAQRHVENILSKLAFNSRTQVAAWAIGEGLTADQPRP
jgi:ATP/maltotriose-dependent transcriptional regulator MalT